MVHNQPTPVAIPVNKTESRGTAYRLARSVKSRANKGVGSGVDGKVTIDANPLLAEHAPVMRGCATKEVKILTNAGWVVANRWRRRPPQYSLGIIEGENPFLIMATHGIDPC